VPEPDFRMICADLVRLIEQCPPTTDSEWIQQRMNLLFRARTAMRDTRPDLPDA
jgi:hypothetical protein